MNGQLLLPPEIMELLFLWVFPLMAMIGWTLLIIMALLYPKQAKRLGKLNRRKIVAVVSDDSGMADVWTGNPFLGKFIDFGKNIVALIPTVPKDNPKAGMSELVNKRYILRGVGKPIYFIHQMLAVAANPEVVANLSFDLSDEEKGKLKKKLKKKKLSIGFAYRLDDLKDAINENISFELIEGLIEWAERRGLLKSKFGWGQAAIPIMTIMICLFFAIVILKYAMG